MKRIVFEEALRKSSEKPLFVRGSCAEDARFLLGKGESYRWSPRFIHATPVRDGFEQTSILPLQPIPPTYRLPYVRDYAVSWANGDDWKVSLYRTGQQANYTGAPFDSELLGAVIYFGSSLLHQCEYIKDTDGQKGREHELCAVRIAVNHKPCPESILFVEPLGPLDYDLLTAAFPRDKRILLPRFRDQNEKEELLASLAPLEFGAFPA